MRSSEFITEATLDLDQDVDIIYRKYFEMTIIDVRRTETLRKEWIKEDEFTTAELISDICKQAHEINPCKIYMNRSDFSYNHMHKELDFGFDRGVVNALLRIGGSLTALIDKSPNSKARILRPFSPNFIRGAIAHELAHWVRDSLHNSHIEKVSDRSRIAGKRERPRGKNEYAGNIEMDSMIHEMKQVRRKTSDEKWDSLTFAELGDTTALNFQMTSIDSKNIPEFIQTLKKRMFREGLLGKNMR